MNGQALTSAVGSGSQPGSSPPSSGTLRIAVGIATAGRKAILSVALDLLARQSRPPDMLVVCPAAAEDLESGWPERLPFSTVVRIGKRGLTAQRNTILSVVRDADVIVYFDDDFFPQLNYLEEVERLFLGHADVVALTGRPMQDGANGPGVEAELALRLIAADVSAPRAEVLASTYGTYGCNMSFRMEAIRQHGVLFDENLPLYGWQEDIDFSRQLAPFGRIVDANVLRGVHLGTKGGRTSGARFGYSQVANPVYLIRKGTMSVGFAAALMWRNVLANAGRSFRPEPWIDRRGRLRGNWLALWDLVTRRMSPHRIFELT
jgi:glycosyltransferase involved in cell wall biosynthesis